VTLVRSAAYLHRMKVLLVVVLAFALAGCGGRGSRVVIVPSGDRLAWASQLGRADAVPDPPLVKRVTEAATASGARVLDVAVLAVGKRRAPAVTLQSSDPAAYMKDHLRGFLQRIGYLEPDALAFVELVDDHGRFAWSAGRFQNGGMVHPRPDLDQCSPIVHSQLVGSKPPPCPAA
jgi:threonine dehydrogenase-like Zn-dependent dehydrogenase